LRSVENVNKNEGYGNTVERLGDMDSFPHPNSLGKIYLNNILFIYKKKSSHPRSLLLQRKRLGIVRSLAGSKKASGTTTRMFICEFCWLHVHIHTLQQGVANSVYTRMRIE